MGSIIKKVITEEIIYIDKELDISNTDYTRKLFIFNLLIYTYKYNRVSKVQSEVKNGIGFKK